jgi:hypothetical protein
MGYRRHTQCFQHARTGAVDDVDRAAIHDDGEPGQISSRELTHVCLEMLSSEDLRAFDLEDLPGVVDHLVAQPHDGNAEDDAPGPRRFQRVLELGAPCLAGTACARLRQAKRAQQRLVDPGQLSANTFIARTEGVEVTCSRPFPCFLPLSRSDS